LKLQLSLAICKEFTHRLLVQIQTIAEDNKVTKVDGTAVTTLVIAYNLPVDNK